MGEVSEVDKGVVDLSDVQGNVLRGYRKSNVRHIVLEVVDAPKTGKWLSDISSDTASASHQVTDAAHWGDQPPAVCFNVAFTHKGLRALRLPASTLSSFPAAYQEGMAARAMKLGDWDQAAPSKWYPWFQPESPTHVIVSLHANGKKLLDEFEQTMFDGLAGQALRKIGQNDGANFNGDEVHFGYQDNISQPRFEGITAPGKFDDQPSAPLGTVLLGHQTAFEQLTWALPTPHKLGINGTYNAYRVLAQDCMAFENYLGEAAQILLAHPASEELLPTGSEQQFGESATRLDAMRELVAAKFLGRWRTGTPLALSPYDPSPSVPVSKTDFDYTDDVDGLKCPFSAHTRRCNPRGGKIVQKVANHTRRLVRRGIPYGPRFDRAQPNDIERGLLGNFLCGNLSAQFEAVQYDWINLGLQDPRITGSNDPILGANSEDHSWFELPTGNGVIRLRGFPRFVWTRGGAYTFIPSLSGLRCIAQLTAK